eukprot:5173439-Amphidinium_carterae.1
MPVDSRPWSYSSPAANHIDLYMAINSQYRCPSVSRVTQLLPILCFLGAEDVCPKMAVGLKRVPHNLSVGSVMMMAKPKAASNTATWLAHTRPPST